MSSSELESSETSGPDFQQIRKDLAFELDNIQGASAFAYAGDVTTAPNPGLTVEGVGSIDLPLSHRDAEALISKCWQSPFGTGWEIIVDTNIQSSLELSPTEFSFRNPAWDSCINALLDIVYRELGLTCGRQNVSAELRNLLLYCEGAFFQPHQDSEKLPGMFGTMVVCFPSEHEGGDVVLKHNNSVHILDSAKSSDFGMSFAAWYSNVHHEIRKITAGYLLVVTYTLVQQKTSVPQKVPDGDAIRRLATRLKSYNDVAKDDAIDWPNFLMYSMEHEYSQARLTLSSLRDKDFYRANALKSACENVGFDIFLALKEKVLKTGDHGDDVVEALGQNLKDVMDLDGQSEPFYLDYGEDNKIDIDAATDDGDREEKEEGVCTGDECTTAAQRYRRSVVLVVPPSRRVEFYFQAKREGFAIPLKLFKKFQTRGLQPGSLEYQQLERLCSLTLDRTKYKGIGGYAAYHQVPGHKDEAKSQCMECLAAIALEMDWCGVYDQVAARYKRGHTALEALGAFLSRHQQQSEKVTDLEGLLKEEQDLRKQVDAIRSVRRGLENGNACQKTKDDIDTLGSHVLQQFLAPNLALRKKVADQLAYVVRHFPYLANDVWSQLEKCATPTKGAFFLHLVRYISENDRSEAVESVLNNFIPRLWHGHFVLEDPEFCKTTTTSSWPRQTIHVAGSDLLTTDELIGLLEITNAYGKAGLTVFEALRILQTSFPRASLAYVNAQLMSFITRLVRRDIPAIFGTNQPAEVIIQHVRDLLVAALTTVIRKRIGEEPRPDTSFSLPIAPCTCADCNEVNDFLSSPTRTQHDLRRIEPQRRHLNKIFKPRAGIVYRIEIVRCHPPFVWRITKTFERVHQREHDKWAREVGKLQYHMRQLAAVDDSVLSKDVLGEECFERLMSCEPERVGGALGRMPLMDGDANVKKREADDNSDDEGEDGNKRVKGTDGPGGGVLVDVT